MARADGALAVTLARAVCLAVLVEPGLLRRARIALVPGAGVGTESDLWFSPLVLTRNVTGIVLDPDVVAVLRQQLGADPEFAERARALVERLHRGYPPAVQLEEEIAWQAVRGGSTAGPDIEAGLRAAVKAMVTDPGGGRDVARWAAQAWRRLPETVTQTEAARLLAVGFALRLGTAAGVTSLGQQAMPASLGWLMPQGPAEWVQLGVRLAADGLRFVEPSADGLVFELPRTSPLVVEIGWHDGAAPRRQTAIVAAGVDVALGSIVGPLTLRTLAGQRYVIEPELAQAPSSSPEASWGQRRPRVVNPPPAPVPDWFQDRDFETALLAEYLIDPGTRMVWVTGPAGVGKTALVCRLLSEVERGRITGSDSDRGGAAVTGIVYLSSNSEHQAAYPFLVADLLQLLPADAARSLRGYYEDPGHGPREVMLRVLAAFPAEEPVVVLLDDPDTARDTTLETLAEEALREALTAVLTAPAHGITVVVTARITPTAPVSAEPPRQQVLWLEKGLSAPDARAVLRALDDDGHLGLRDAPDTLLDDLRQVTQGFPRALDAIKAILDSDSTLTPRDLLDRARRVPQNRVVQMLVGEAYDLLDASEQQVLQALSVYPAPVAAAGVDFLLRPVSPSVDAAPILDLMVRRRMVNIQDGRYYLHALDRGYARSRLPPGRPGDPPAAFTLAGLRGPAADYLAEQGSYAAALELQGQHLDSLAQALGPEHPQTLAARASLARWTGQAGDAAEARDQFAVLLPDVTRVLGPDDQETLEVRASLVRWTGEAGDPAGARDQFAVLLPDVTRVLGPDDQETLEVRAGLASWTGEAGDPAGARDQLAELLPAVERVFGTDHPESMSARASLARWTGQAGDPAGARDQFAVLLPGYTRMLGADHPETLVIRAGLASWTGEAGDPAGARDQFAELLPAVERVLGADHPESLRIRASVARWTGEAGDPAGARDQFAALVPAVERIQGREHPDTLRYRLSLARWTGEAGDPAGARDQFAVLLPARERVLGPNDPDAAAIRRALTSWTVQASEFPGPEGTASRPEG